MRMQYQRPLPRRRENRTIRGTEADYGKWIRCASCNFINPITRRGSHIERTTVPVSSTDTTLTLDGVGILGVIIMTTDYSYSPASSIATRGCRFCGREL